MDALKAIFTRRSIRAYTKQTIDNADIKLLLKAAMQAPSANNYQPWHFIIIDDKNILLEIPKFHPYAEMLKQAPVAIVICGDTTKEKNIDYISQDCSAATENILIAAHAIGIGAVWLGIFPKKDRVKSLSDLLALPEYIVPISIVSLGFPLQKKHAVDRFNPTRIHKNKW